MNNEQETVATGVVSGAASGVAQSPQASPLDDTFRPAQRAIYRYDNGVGKVLCVDPLQMRLLLSNKAIVRSKTLQGLIDDAKKIDLAAATPIEINEAGGALLMLAEIATEAFDLVPFNRETGIGADTAHAIAVLNHFHRWCEKKNPKHVTRQTSLPVTEPISATPPITDTSSV